eukprot:1710224-Heterocapsa_arctica.AAC.1
MLKRALDMARPTNSMDPTAQTDVPNAVMGTNAERDKCWAIAGWIFFHNTKQHTSKSSSDSGDSRARVVARGNGDNAAMPIVTELATPNLGPV